MSHQKIDFHDQIQQSNNEITNDCVTEFVYRQPWNGAPNSDFSSTIMNQFNSFVPAERYIGGGLPYDQQINSSKNYCSDYGSYSYSGDGFGSLAEQNGSDLQSRTKALICGNNQSNFYGSGKCYENSPGGEYNGNDPIQNLLVDFVNLEGRNFSFSTNEKQDFRFCDNSYGLVNGQLNFSIHQEKQAVNCGNLVSSSGAVISSSKSRIRWSTELHEKFVDCVNRLGGADKATPKAILKLMNSDGLTIFHVKSHLQKYRIAKFVPDSTEGKSDQKRSSLTDVPQLDMKTGIQLKEALQLQLDVQRRLHEQLEIQRNLQLRIEEQGRQLKMMFDQQQKASKGTQNNSDILSQDGPSFSFEASSKEGFLYTTNNSNPSTS